MRLTGLDILDAPIQKTNIWLREFMQEVNWNDRKRSYAAFRCVLHGLRDSLQVDQAVFVGEQLPMLLRGIYFEHWANPTRPNVWVTKEDFFSGLKGYMAASGLDPAESETIVRGVFRLLERKAIEGEIADLHDILPNPLREFWPPSLRAA
jgi:uncharacterized protein (DUF2267 family)